MHKTRWVLVDVVIHAEAANRGLLRSGRNRTGTTPWSDLN